MNYLIITILSAAIAVLAIIQGVVSYRYYLKEKNKNPDTIYIVPGQSNPRK